MINLNLKCMRLILSKVIAILDLSTGQKVIIMYSLIYAFRKVANFEGVLFVDNIFPNLSDSVKTRAFNLIPQLFNHIVLVQLKGYLEI